MHVYKSYGIKFISLNSKINNKNFIQNHIMILKIIQRKFKEKNFYKYFVLAMCFDLKNTKT